MKMNLAWVSGKYSNIGITLTLLHIRLRVLQLAVAPGVPATNRNPADALSQPHLA
jgi:hypothetical protein